MANESSTVGWPFVIWASSFFNHWDFVIRHFPSALRQNFHGAIRMKSNTTVLWFVLAALLAAGIWLREKYFQPAAPGENFVFAGLRANQVTSIQIIPAGGREISVTRSNQTWLLEKPFAYPAQAAAIDGLLGTLEKLTPSLSFSAAEMSGRKDADTEFGFASPQFTLDLAAGDQTWHQTGR